MGKIRIVRDGMNLMTMKIKKVNPIKYKNHYGELDIMIDAALNHYFQKVSLQTEYGRMPMPIRVNAISWHGFYFDKNNVMQLPVVNFKQDKLKNKKAVRISIRHSGTINQKDIFAFPICSLYLPEYNFAFNLPPHTPRISETILRLHPGFKARVDFFILPEGVLAGSFFNNTSVSLFYLFNDITLFDKSRNGSLELLPEDPRGINVVVQCIKVENHDLIVRTVYSNKTREPDLHGNYSILMHDPNNAINMILNRVLSYDKEEILALRDLHKKEIGSLDKHGEGSYREQSVFLREKSH